MGLLADFFVAPLEDALRYEESLAHRPVNAAHKPTSTTCLR